MITATRIAAASALALALAACGEKSKPDPYLQNLPDAAALTLETGAAPSGVALTEAGNGGLALAAVVDPAPVSSLQNDLAVVRAKAEEMNAALRAVFAQVDALTASGGQVLTGSVKQWGPATRCVQPDGAGGCVPGGEASLVLRARHWNDHLGDFVVLATSVSGSTYRPVLAGYLMRGAMDRRGAGKVWVNHENLRAAAPGFKGAGYLAAGFAAGPVAKAVTYRMLEFTRDLTDPAGHPAVTATFTGWKNGAGVVRARVAGFADLDKTTSAEELGFWRAVWAPARGGRSFTIITDGRNPGAGGAVTGDVPAGKYWFARACYPAGQTTPSYKEWFFCDRGTGPAACILQTAGVGAKEAGVGDPALTRWSETSCAAADAAIPDADRGEVLPPTGAPHDGADDDREEDGAGHVGLLPEPCPTTATSVMNPDQTPPGMQGPGMGGPGAPGMGGMM